MEFARDRASENHSIHAAAADPHRVLTIPVIETAAHTDAVTHQARSSLRFHTSQAITTSCSHLSSSHALLPLGATSMADGLGLLGSTYTTTADGGLNFR